VLPSMTSFGLYKFVLPDSPDQEVGGFLLHPTTDIMFFTGGIGFSTHARQFLHNSCDLSSRIRTLAICQVLLCYLSLSFCNRNRVIEVDNVGGTWYTKDVREREVM
jgi:hypothetical protein